jgi:hypothetical protein
LLALSTSGFAKKADKEGLMIAIADFDKALIDKDSVALKRLLSDEVSYGHSNAWLENKQEVIVDLYNGKLTYKKIEQESPEIKIYGKSASVRTVANIDAVLDGKLMSFKLKVLQVWVWKNNHWELFARQSVTMPKEK